MGVSVVYVLDHRDLVGSVRATRAGLPAHVPLLLGGAAASTLPLEGLAGVVTVASLPELRALLRHLGEGRAA